MHIRQWSDYTDILSSRKSHHRLSFSVACQNTSSSSIFQQSPPLLITTMSKKSNFFDIGMFTAFHNVIVHVCIVTALLLVNNGCSCPVELPPRDVLQDVITEFVDRYDVGYIFQQQTSSPPSSHRKRKMIDYDRERASKCARSNWFSPVPRFDDKQFERTFRLKKLWSRKLSPVWPFLITSGYHPLTVVEDHL